MQLATQLATQLAIPALSTIVSTLLAATLPAQEDHFTSSPNGFTLTEGGSSNSLIGSAATLRYQQVDATNFGARQNRNRIAFRRDGLSPDNPLYGARNVELEVVLAEGRLLSFLTAFDSNYVSGTDALVFTKKTVAFPDWTVAPATTPANHDLVLMLDTLWSYRGKAVTGTDLLWEVRVYGNDSAGNPYPMDFDLVIPRFVTGIATPLGTSTCTATGASGPYTGDLDVLNFGTRMQIDIDVTNAAPNAPAAYMLGIPQVTPLQPMFCGDLRVLPLFVIPLGSTNAAGFAAQSFNAPYSPASIGASLAGQAVVADPDQPNGIALGQGEVSTVPLNPPTTPQCKHISASSPTAAIATGGIVDGGIIVLTDHP